MNRPKPLKNLFSFLGKKAPKLATTLVEGGLNVATGGVFGDIKSAIIGSNELTPADKETALAALNNEHEAYLSELQDLQDARSMYVETSKSEDIFIRRFPAYLAAGLILLVVLITIALVFIEIPESNQSVLYMLLGVFGGLLSSIGAFYFGSSSASKEKTSQLSKLLTQLK